MEKETLTVKDVAAYLRVHTDMVYALVKQKQIPHMRLGSRILFTKESIHHWVLDQEEKSLNEEE